MNIFIEKVRGGDLIVRARAEGDGVIGDVTETVRPGGNFYGIGYDALLKGSQNIGGHMVIPDEQAPEPDEE